MSTNNHIKQLAENKTIFHRFFTAFITIIFALAVNVNAQENWVKYGNNPVLKRDTVIANLPNDLIAISDCWVIKEGATYKMWYTCGGANFPPDSLLRSRICYCTSLDGIAWSKYSGNPVLDVSYTGGWDSLGVETVSIIIDSLAPANERYKMWYAGQYFNAYRYDFGYAYSADGINWTKHPTQVLEVGGATSWEGGFIEGPSVIKEGNMYKMWYAGYSLVNGKTSLGYATSTDGMLWTKYANNPVMTTSTNGWDSIYVQDPHVIKIGNTYHMWYGGVDRADNYGQQIGYANSTDGINWIKSQANPVLTRGNLGEWDANTASFGSVLLDGGTFKMWYTGKDIEPLIPGSLNYFWEIGYASDTTFMTAITPLNGKEVYNFYPNPFSIQTTMQSNKPLINANITVYNAIGQQVKELKNISGQTIIFERDNLPNGFYFLRLSQDNKLIITQKLTIAD